MATLQRESTSKRRLIALVGSLSHAGGGLQWSSFILVGFLSRSALKSAKRAEANSNGAPCCCCLSTALFCFGLRSHSLPAFVAARYHTEASTSIRQIRLFSFLFAQESFAFSPSFCSCPLKNELFSFLVVKATLFLSFVMFRKTSSNRFSKCSRRFPATSYDTDPSPNPPPVHQATKARLDRCPLCVCDTDPPSFCAMTLGGSLPAPPSTLNDNLFSALNSCVTDCSRVSKSHGLSSSSSCTKRVNVGQTGLGQMFFVTRHVIGLFERFVRDRHDAFA